MSKSTQKGSEFKISFIESKVYKYWSVIISDGVAYLKSSLLTGQIFKLKLDCVYPLEIILKDFLNAGHYAYYIRSIISK